MKYIVNRLTELAVFARVTRCTATHVRVDGVDACSIVLTWIAQTTVIICKSNHNVLREACKSRS